jgi:hypothetical protein
MPGKTGSVADLGISPIGGTSVCVVAETGFNPRAARGENSDSHPPDLVSRQPMQLTDRHFSSPQTIRVLGRGSGIGLRMLPCLAEPVADTAC